ncbi:protein Mpv17 [Copidosoma floridanum]|uniref:protein Mpv17 n=1 Tax=Copidosoma floridanum TaxID=29053 RepID=UPI0006C9A30B|nr:protein Mpv17 [Copidosoma floridanum]
MSRIFRTYQSLLRKFPTGMQAVQAGTLMGLGDQIAQNVIEKRPPHDLDLVRTGQFSCIGFFIVGPTVKAWYGILDKYIGSKGAAVVLKKVICDQLLFAPCFTVILLSMIGAMQGNRFDGIKLKLENEYTEIMINNYKLWPAVQLINFYLVPLHYQVLVVQAVAVLWNTYISYRTNKDNTINV